MIKWYKKNRLTKHFQPAGRYSSFKDHLASCNPNALLSVTEFREGSQGDSISPGTRVHNDDIRKRLEATQQLPHQRLIWQYSSGRRAIRRKDTILILMPRKADGEETQPVLQSWRGEVFRLPKFLTPLGPVIKADEIIQSRSNIIQMTKGPVDLSPWNSRLFENATHERLRILAFIQRTPFNKAGRLHWASHMFNCQFWGDSITISNWILVPCSPAPGSLGTLPKAVAWGYSYKAVSHEKEKVTRKGEKTKHTNYMSTSNHKTAHTLIT